VHGGQLRITRLQVAPVGSKTEVALNEAIDEALDFQGSAEPSIEMRYGRSGLVAVRAVRIKIRPHAVLDRRGFVIQRARLDKILELRRGERGIEHAERVEGGELVRVAASGGVVERS